jgi:hypothetical protein
MGYSLYTRLPDRATAQSMLTFLTLNLRTPSELYFPAAHNPHLTANFLGESCGLSYSYDSSDDRLLGFNVSGTGPYHYCIINWIAIHAGDEREVIPNFTDEVFPVIYYDEDKLYALTGYTKAQWVENSRILTDAIPCTTIGMKYPYAPPQSTTPVLSPLINKLQNKAYANLMGNEQLTEGLQSELEELTELYLSQDTEAMMTRIRARYKAYKGDNSYHWLFSIIDANLKEQGVDIQSLTYSSLIALTVT